MSMQLRLIGASPSDSVASMGKFRVTWELSDLVPSFVFNAVTAANEIRNALPGYGFVPVSNPSALPGDETVSYDVRLGSTWGGKHVSDVVAQLDRVPPAFSWRMSLTRVERLTGSESSTDLTTGQTDNRTEEEQGAAADNLFAKVKAMLGRVGTVATVALLIIAVGGAVYLARRK